MLVINKLLHDKHTNCFSDLPENHADKMSSISKQWLETKKKPEVLANLQKEASEKKERELSSLTDKGKWSLIRAINKKMDKLVCVLKKFTSSIVFIIKSMSILFAALVIQRCLCFVTEFINFLL